MKIIRDIKQLDGTCYIEVLPGRYQGKCWNEDSIFFTEEDFGYLEKSIEHEYSNYDHYAFNEIPEGIWERILGRLEGLLTELHKESSIESMKTDIGFFFRCSEEEFQQDYEINLAKLIVLIREFQEWINEQLKRTKYISVLGI